MFYYWWEYLQRHDGYRETCEAGGIGQYAKLYADFGDVHSGDFWSWWAKHDHLFAEPRARQAELVDHAELSKQASDDVLFPLRTTR